MTRGRSNTLLFNRKPNTHTLCVCLWPGGVTHISSYCGLSFSPVFTSPTLWPSPSLPSPPPPPLLFSFILRPVWSSCCVRASLMCFICAFCIIHSCVFIFTSHTWKRQSICVSLNIVWSVLNVLDTWRREDGWRGEEKTREGWGRGAALRHWEEIIDERKSSFLLHSFSYLFIRDSLGQTEQLRQLGSEEEEEAGNGRREEEKEEEWAESSTK